MNLETAFTSVGALGLLLIAIGTIMDKKTPQAILFILGGICLEAYSIFLGSTVFIVLQLLFIAAALYGLMKKNSLLTRGIGELGYPAVISIVIPLSLFAGMFAIGPISNFTAEYRWPYPLTISTCVAAFTVLYIQVSLLIRYYRYLLKRVRGEEAVNPLTSVMLPVKEDPLNGTLAAPFTCAGLAYIGILIAGIVHGNLFSLSYGITGILVSIAILATGTLGASFDEPVEAAQE